MPIQKKKIQEMMENVSEERRCVFVLFFCRNYKGGKGGYKVRSCLEKRKIVFFGRSFARVFR